MKLQTLSGTTTNVSSHFMHLWDCSTGKWMQKPINLPDAWMLGTEFLAYI